MDEPTKQPEGASHQAVGALLGALCGLGIAARQIFADYGEAAQLPWVQGIGITLGGGVVGLLLATILGAGNTADDPVDPPVSSAAEEHAESRLDPPRQEGTDSRIVPGHSVNGTHKPDDPAQAAR